MYPPDPQDNHNRHLNPPAPGEQRGRMLEARGGPAAWGRRGGQPPCTATKANIHRETNKGHKLIHPTPHFSSYNTTGAAARCPPAGRAAAAAAARGRHRPSRHIIQYSNNPRKPPPQQKGTTKRTGQHHTCINKKNKHPTPYPPPTLLII